MRAALYARISTKDGRQFAENQVTEIRTYCDRQGWKVVKEYIDHATGSKGISVRDQLALLMEDAHRRRFDIVVVFALDRFTREGVLKAFQYIERLQAANVEFRSVTEEHFQTSGPAGELFMAVSAWMAKQERAQLQKRIMAGLDRARAAGKTLGRKPILVDAVKISELRAEHYSIRDIGLKLGLSRATVARNLERIDKRAAVVTMPMAEGA